MSFILKPLKEAITSIRPSAPTYLPEDYPDLTGKIVLITGTSAGVGKESAKLLLKQNATVVFANRNKSKTDDVIEQFIQELQLEDRKLTSELISERIVSITVDLSDLTSIKPAVEDLKAKGIEKLDIVILNAGVMQPPNGSITKQGWELQFGVNVIGHQLLLDLINPLILNAKSSSSTPRVIFLSSAAYYMSPSNGGLTWDFKDASKASAQLIYGQSKVSNAYQAYIYGEDHKQEGIISLSVHPGLLNSELFRTLPKLLQPALKYVLYPPVYGAYTELFAALNPDITVEDNGRFIGPWGQFREFLRADIIESLTNGTARKLWDYIENEIEEYK